MSMIEESQANQNEDSDVPTNGAVDAENESQSEDEVIRIISFKKSNFLSFHVKNS